MREKIKNLRFIYIFYFSAVLVLVGTLTIYTLFGETKNYIEEVTQKIYIQDTQDLAYNFAEMIANETGKNIYINLKEDENLREKLEKNLQLFISKRYRYIYVVDKAPKGQNYRFLLDGSKKVEEKSDFGEFYEPLHVTKFQEAYKSAHPVYFTQENAHGVWITFLQPILKDGKTDALLVVDFSMQGHKLIDNSLSELDGVLKISIYVGIFIFIIIVFFSYIDHKRVKVLESFKDKLEMRVRQEVEKNRQKEQQLIEQSRLAQMGEMISMIAHQWRQPLSAISSASASISLKAMLGKLDNETALEISTAISDYAQHLSTTIDDFRNFFKSNKEKQEITYTELIENVLGIIEVSIENKNIKLVKHLHSNKSFYSYPNELKQVLLNLIKNAEDILLEKKVENPTITIETDENILRVRDNAGGIPPDIMHKIFDPYFSTKLDKNGTGLGLYMSKTIIEEHCHGKLLVKNDEEGAVFTIVLDGKKD